MFTLGVFSDIQLDVDDCVTTACFDYRNHCCCAISPPSADCKVFLFVFLHLTLRFVSPTESPLLPSGCFGRALIQPDFPTMVHDSYFCFEVLFFFFLTCAECHISAFSPSSSTCRYASLSTFHSFLNLLSAEVKEFVPRFYTPRIFLAPRARTTKRVITLITLI